jgi:hypothetical protein
MYIHHTSITIHVLLLYTSSTFLGRLAVLHSLCPLQLVFKKIVNTLLKISKGSLLAACKMMNLYPASKNYFVPCKKLANTVLKGFKQLLAIFL